MQLTLNLTFDPGLVLRLWGTSSCVSLPILEKIDAPTPKFCSENQNMPPNNTGVNGIFGFSARFFQCMLSAFWPVFWNQRELRLDLWLEIEETPPFNNFLPLWGRWPQIGVKAAPEPSVAFLLEGSVHGRALRCLLMEQSFTHPIRSDRWLPPFSLEQILIDLCWPL